MGNDLSKTEGIHPVCVDDGGATILYGLLCVKPDNTKDDYLIDLLLTPQEFEECRIKYSLPRAWGILPGWDELLSEYDDLRQYYREKVRTSSRPLPPYEKWGGRTVRCY